MADRWTRCGSVLAVAALLLPVLGAPRIAHCESGVSFGFVLDGYPIASARLSSLREQTGVAYAMVTFFLQWPHTPAEGHFPLETLKAIGGAGALPCITWEPMTILDGKETAIDAKDILSGRYDGYIDRFARSAREYGRPLLIRFAHEMNLERYHWGSPKDRYGPESPALYRQMFRHVVKRFRAAKASNVFFAFCPNAESLPHPERDQARWNVARAYYPGDDVVDVVGMDGYNWGTTQTRDKHGWNSAFRSFPEIFGQMRAELAAMAPAKPMMVFEMASAAQGGDKAAWMREALHTAASWNLVALNWFEADKEVDWRLATGTGSAVSALLREKIAPGPAGIAAALQVRNQ